MFCPKCGVEIQDGSMFCMKCGTKIKSKNKTVTNYKLIKKRLKIIIPIICVIIIIGIGGFIYWKNTPSQKAVSVCDTILYGFKTGDHESLSTEGDLFNEMINADSAYTELTVTNYSFISVNPINKDLQTTNDDYTSKYYVTYLVTYSDEDGIEKKNNVIFTIGGLSNNTSTFKAMECNGLI